MPICSRIKKIFILFVTFLCLRCATSSPKHISDAGSLADSQSSDAKDQNNIPRLECSTLPTPDGAIAIKRLILSGNLTSGVFLTESMGRKGQIVYHLRPTLDLERILDKSANLPISIPQQYRLIGIADATEGPVGILYRHHQDRDIELRNFSDNTTMAEFKMGAHDPFKGYLDLNDNGDFVAVFQDTTGENEAFFGRIIKKGGHTTDGMPDRIEGFKYHSKSINHNTHKLLVTIESKRKDSKFENFLIIKDPHSNISKQMKLESITDEIETWDVISNRTSFLLALVTGNSLLGSAALKIVRIDESLSGKQPEILRETSLDHEHSTPPVWVSTKQGPLLYQANWIDESGRLVTYQVASTGVLNSNFIGSIPVASSIVGVAESEDRKTRFLFISHKDQQDKQQFLVCPLEVGS